MLVVIVYVLISNYCPDSDLTDPAYTRFSTFTLKYRFTLDSSHHHHTPLYIEILSREISMWQVCATYIWISFTKLVLIGVQLDTHSRSDN